MNNSLIDTFWVLVCAGQVFLMQAGFLCLESGLTRTKNNINVAVKNLTDLGISVIIFWSIGYGLMFGTSSGGWFGTTSFMQTMSNDGAFLAAFLIFEIMFCSTAATILSGAAAERMRFSGYIIVTILVSSIIYPVFGHWAWNGLNSNELTGWLGARGFVDFAGSTVVHSVGGWVSLATVIVIGARAGRFSKNKPPRNFHGTNLSVAVLGALILWFGWFGFNGGSTFALTEQVPKILINTALAGAAGMLTTLILGKLIWNQTHVWLLINGVIAGLVAITASVHATTFPFAILIGGIGGIVMLGVDYLLKRLRIDDAVGAIPVHLGAGIWGTLAVALFGQSNKLGTGLDRFGQLQIQLFGIVVCCVWAFGITYIVLKLINHFYPLRVTAEAETIGLNVAEHGASSELLDLFTVMDYQSKTGDLSIRASAEPYTEVGRVAERYNRVIESLERTEKKLETAHAKLVRKERLMDNLVSTFLFRHDVNGIFNYVSSSVTLVLGYTNDEFLTHYSKYLTNHPVNQELKKYTEQSIKGIQQPPYEVQIIHKDGSIHWLEVSESPVRDKNGKVVAVEGVAHDITQHKQSQEALFESGERFRNLADLLPETVFETDRNLNLTFANQRALELFGYTEEDLKSGLNGLDILTPEYRELAKETLTGWLLGEISETIEYQAMKKDGTTFPILFHASSIFKEGEIIGLRGIIVDITERKKAEEDLKESEWRLSLHIQNTPIMVIEWNKDFEVVEWNKAAERVFGYTKEEVLGKHAAGLIVPESAKEQVDKVWKDLIDQKGGFHSINENLTKCGRTIICDWYNTPLIEKSGKVYGVASLVQDITERKETEEANARLSRAIEHAAETIVITDSLANIQYVNPAFEKTTGFTSKEVIGKNPRILKSGLHDEAFYEKMWDTLLSGKEWHGEITNMKKDGTLFIERAVISPVFDAQGSIVNYVAARNDITETKRLQELESRAEKLETAGIIAGQVAHDFNNLLAPMMAYPDLIRDDLPKNHPSLKFLDQIEKSTMKIADINQDLLAMGRRGHYNLEVMNLNTVIQHALEEIKPYPKKIVCKSNLCADLMNILGGTSQLNRVINNLLHNAMDAMHGKGKLTLKTENYYIDHESVVYGRVPKGEYVKLTISDTGDGIPDNIIQKIFDPFFTSKKADKKRGSGLGMSVVDAVIKDHNGYIDLITKVGEGTSFFIYFPVTRKCMGIQDSDEILGGNETILVVDDDEIQREVSSLILSNLGYEIKTIESGEKAIEFLSVTPQNLIILDMIMPDGIDGAETYRQILEINPYQKAIILSGFSESERVLKAQKLGAGAFVKKPFTKEVIADAVRTELDKDTKVLT